MAAESAISVTGARVRFGGIVAVDGVDLAIAPGEVLGVIGPNGAGKSTLVDAISGLVPLAEGRIVLGGRDVTRALPYKRARLGLARTFQDARLFQNMSVRETLAGALHQQLRGGILAEGFGVSPIQADERAVAEDVDRLMDVVDVRRYLSYRHADLSLGTARAVELAWLAAQRPAVILLDEPAAGLQQSEVEVLGPLIERIRGDAAVLLIDHDVPFVRDLADRLIAMDLGRVIAEGEPGAVLAHSAVVASYVGATAVGRAT